MCSYWTKGWRSSIFAFDIEDLDNASQRKFEELFKEVFDVPDDMDEIRARVAPLNFVLTKENMFKMIAICYRVRAGIPVLVMGETGCGKTFCVTYLCKFLGISFHALDVHGGTMESDILHFMNNPDGPLAAANAPGAPEVWCFFDEVCYPALLVALDVILFI